MGNQAVKPGDYQEPDLPEGVLEVRLSVYKLGLTGAPAIDGIAASWLGTFHTGVAVGGREWTFLGPQRGSAPGCSGGVMAHQPEALGTHYIFFQRKVMGRAKMSEQRLFQEIFRLGQSSRWQAENYDIIENNCNNFASELCWLLVRRRPPYWVNELASNMARDSRVHAMRQNSLIEAFDEYTQQYARSPKDCPGAAAFARAYAESFDLIWSKAWEESQQRAEWSLDGEDPEEIRAQGEAEGVQVACKAALAVALAVGEASRLLEEKRLELELHVDDRRSVASAQRQAFERKWRSAGSALVRDWQAAAVVGKPIGEQERRQQVSTALEAAQAAAVAAALERPQPGCIACRPECGVPQDRWHGF